MARQIMVGSQHVDSKATPKVAMWAVVDDVLHVLLPDGSMQIPTADEIYRIAIEGENVDGLPKPVSVAEYGDIAFSRYPLTIEVRIEADGSGPQPGLRTVVCAVGGGHVANLGDVGARRPDHVVVKNQWYPLARGSIQETQAILAEASITAVGMISLKQYLKLLQISQQHPVIRDLSGETASASKQKAPKEGGIPPTFSGKLYPYQNDGWRWLQLLSSQDVGGILADEMGLGKTVQIAVLLAAEAEVGRGASLVIATGTLLENWRRELAKFASKLDVLIHRGGDRSGFPSDLLSHDVVVTSYDTLVRDLSLFQQIPWNIVVLDEAQAIKNPETKRTAAVKQIPRRVGLAVTGTPMENRLTDLWSIVDFALPGLLGSLGNFNRLFANDPDGAAALEPLVSPILLRRRVAEVAGDLPARIDIPQALVLSPDQAAAYEALRLQILADYGKSGSLVALIKLRMFCAHPKLLGATTADTVLVSAKYERLTEILDEILDRKEKAIIFTSFNEMTNLLISDLGCRFDVPACFIDGRTKIDERQDTVDKFSNVTGGAILVLNPKAAGTGLNITAANHVIHYNLEWNPAVEDQASARAYRRGQTLPVTVHRLFYVDTVEQTIDERLTAKRQLFEKAIVGTDGSDDNLSDIAAALARSPVRKGVGYDG